MDRMTTINKSSSKWLWYSTGRYH